MNGEWQADDVGALDPGSGNPGKRFSGIPQSMVAEEFRLTVNLHLDIRRIAADDRIINPQRPGFINSITRGAEINTNTVNILAWFRQTRRVVDRPHIHFWHVDQAK